MAATEVVESKFDTAKLVLAMACLIAGIWAFYFYAEQYILLYRVLGLLGVMSIALIVVYQTAIGKSIWQYLQDSRTELRKVVWPTRNETIQTTLIVSIVVVIAGCGLWLMDIFFGWLVRWLLGLGG